MIKSEKPTDHSGKRTGLKYLENTFVYGSVEASPIEKICTVCHIMLGSYSEGREWASPVYRAIRPGKVNIPVSV